jgi:NADH-quinone oxidoreductase subunit M
MVFFTLASVGLPGLNGFVSEFLCLIGAFQSNPGTTTGPGATFGALGPWYAAIAGTGMIVAAMYLLLMVGNIVWGTLHEPHGDDHAAGGTPAPHEHGPLPRDLSGREIGILIPLAAGCLILGVFPKPFMDGLRDPVNALAAIVQDPMAKAGGEGDAVSMAPPPATSEEAPR